MHLSIVKYSRIQLDIPDILEFRLDTEVLSVILDTEPGLYVPLANISRKGGIVNILDFVGHFQLCYCTTKAVTDNS